MPPSGTVPSRAASAPKAPTPAATAPEGARPAPGAAPTLRGAHAAWPTAAWPTSRGELRAAWARLVAQVGLTKLVVGGAAVVLVLSAFLLPGGERADPFDGPGAALDLMLKLGAVLALAYVSLAALRRYTAGTASQRGSLLEVLDSTTLGPNRAVYVVRAGDKRLVLGVTQQQITALGELAPDEPTPAAAAPAE